MSAVRTWAVALTGVDGHMVEVEADLSNQRPDFRIIGLADRSLGEATQRVHNACKNAGLELSARRLTVNLSPASLPKQGSAFDLPKSQIPDAGALSTGPVMHRARDLAYLYERVERERRPARPVP